MTDLASRLKNYICLNRTQVPIETMSNMDVQTRSPSLEDKKSIDKIFESINIKSDVGEFKRIKTKKQNPNLVSPIIIEFEGIIQKF